MQVEDLRDQARDVQLLRVTKDLQLGLNEEGQRGKDQHDIETLAKTLELNDRVSKIMLVSASDVTFNIMSGLVHKYPCLIMLLDADLHCVLPVCVVLQVHKKRVREKKRQLAKLQLQSQKRKEENQQLDHTLIEKQVSVLERQAAENLAG